MNRKSITVLVIAMALLFAAAGASAECRPGNAYVSSCPTVSWQSAKPGNNACASIGGNAYSFSGNAYSSGSNAYSSGSSAYSSGGSAYSSGGNICVSGGTLSVSYTGSQTTAGSPANCSPSVSYRPSSSCPTVSVSTGTTSYWTGPSSNCGVSFSWYCR